MKIGIIQPNYVPWRGYFDFIHQVDTFVFLDDVQYTKRDWRNRNYIKSPSGGKTPLSVPVLGGTEQTIDAARIDNAQPWQRKHLGTIQQYYGKTPFAESYLPGLRDIYGRNHSHLADLDIDLTIAIAEWLGIETRFIRSSELNCAGNKDHKLIAIVERLGGTSYLSGPAAKSYIQPGLWDARGITLEYISYPEYPEYRQISEPFDPNVSVLDLLFMVGPDAPSYIWPDRP